MTSDNQTQEKDIFSAFIDNLSKDSGDFLLSDFKKEQYMFT
jgi:hypothetical protein